MAVVLLYRRIRYGYPFRRIRLTQGKYAIVDQKNYEWLNQYKWHALKNDHTFYAGRTVNKKLVRMHREILKAPYHLLVDHINRNGLDNREANLRLATKSQSNQNRLFRRRKSSRSRYKGVHWYQPGKNWMAQICVNSKNKTIGHFVDEIEAAKAYDKAAKKYHKEFAVINFESK